MNNLGLRVADHISAMLAYWDKNLICRFANAAYVEWFGKGREELVGKLTLEELLGPLYEKNLPYIKGALSGHNQTFEREIILPDGSYRYSLANYFPDFENGEVVGFSVHVADISHTKNLERSLIAAESTFKGLLENASNPIVITDEQGNIQITNGQASDLFGYKKDDLTGKNITVILPDDENNACSITSLLVAEKGFQLLSSGLEFTGLGHDGRQFPLEIGISPILLKKRFCIAISIRDVSRQKEAERLLKESDERNRIFVEQAPNAIAMFDTRMCYLAASQKWVQDYHLAGKKIIGRSHYEIFPEIGEDWKQIHRECLNGAINQCDEAAFERADGSVQWITWDVRPWYIAENLIGGLLIYTADITVLKQKEAEKRNIEEILDKTNEVARIGTWEVDLTTNSIYWSRIAREIHEVLPDYTPKIDGAINFFREGKSRDLIQKAVAKAIAHGTPYDLDLELVTGKGNIVWARSIGQAEFKNGECKRLYGVFQDIDEVKRARDSLYVVNKELQTILNAAHVAIIGTDNNGVITHFSKGAELLLNYSASQMIGIQTPALIHLEDEVIKRGNELTGLFGKPINGFNVFVEVPRRNQFESRNWTYVRKDGSTFPVQLVVTAIKDESGAVIGFLGIATDISDLENVKLELEVLTGALQNKNKQLLNFAHITSHNLRSPVSNLNTVLYLHKEAEDDNEKAVLLGHMETVIGHLTETLDQLVDSLKVQEDRGKEREWLNFDVILEKTKEIFVGAIMETHATITSNFSKAERVEYPITYMESIMLNLLSNAIKYRSPNRKPEIHFETMMTDNGPVLIISDNGLGIDMEKYGDKLFGLNKTFHRHAEAKGVGLFMTKTQIEAMGGSIEADSGVDKGTTFKIQFNKNT